MEIILPASARPAFLCRICKMEFTQRELHQYEHHVARCAVAHEAELHEMGEPMRRWNAPVDAEWEAYNEALRAAGRDPEDQYRRLKGGRRGLES